MVSIYRLVTIVKKKKSYQFLELRGLYCEKNDGAVISDEVSLELQQILQNKRIIFIVIFHGQI